jgi:hypothetical protein
MFFPGIDKFFCKKLLIPDLSAAMLASMDDFLEYLRRRRAAIRKELAELDAAERLYLESGAAGAGVSLSFDFSGQMERPTIKEAVLQVLSEIYPNGLTALEILDRLNRRWWQGKLERTSLSPQISRLNKIDKKVVNERGTWKVRKENAPTENTEEAS